MRNVVKKSLGLLLLAVLITVVIVGVVQSNLSKTEQINDFRLGTEVDFLPTEEGLGIGQVAPDFELTTIDGEVIRLSDYRGKKVFLNFWTSWCPPCRAEMPIMQNYHENDAEANNMEIIAVNLTSKDNGMRAIKEFVEEFGLTMTMPLDTEGTVEKTYQSIAIPTSYTIDTEGRVQKKIVGPLNKELIQEQMDKLD
ncbi:redoxin domain-containing protein [Planomicrobium sp. YIM 101495]|uniref:TlpA family protein disulfide reductase n=1 Tax=Planomicrobium sp. YIM 101495 TaxID=2665160 RepID=UPI0012B77AC4|nr:redoxin domain-containing protein [Planomicrobium sp. YIM 101495]